MRKYLFAALAMVLTLLAAVSFSSAETKNWGPYEVEILNEDDNTVRIVKYNLQKKTPERPKSTWRFRRRWANMS